MKIEKVSCGDDRCQIVIDGRRIEPVIWPSDAEAIAAWFEKAESQIWLLFVERARDIVIRETANGHCNLCDSAHCFYGHEANCIIPKLIAALERAPGDGI